MSMRSERHIVLINTGEHKGQEAHVTWDSPSECLVRVTPVKGGPLTSLEFNYEDVTFLV